MDIEQAKEIDQILKLLIELDNKYKGNTLNPSTASHKLKIPEEETSYLVNILVDQIIFKDRPVVKFLYSNMSGKCFSKNDNTLPFMNAGGCLKWFNDQYEVQSKEEKRKELEYINLENTIKEFKITQEQFEITQAEFEINKKQSKTTKRIAIISIIIAVVTFGIAGITLFLQIVGII